MAKRAKTAPKTELTPAQRSAQRSVRAMKRLAKADVRDRQKSNASWKRRDRRMSGRARRFVKEYYDDFKKKIARAEKGGSREALLYDRNRSSDSAVIRAGEEHRRNMSEDERLEDEARDKACERAERKLKSEGYEIKVWHSERTDYYSVSATW